MKAVELERLGWIIPAGDYRWTWTLPPGWGDNDTWWVGNAHAICHTVYWADSSPFDDALPDPGDFRSEYLGRVTSIGPGGVEWTA